MKLTCEIVEDLLPLYLDDVCSPRSKQAVAEHLKECEQCRKLVGWTQAVSVPSFEPSKPKADRAVKNGFKRIKRYWWASILIVLIAVTLAFSSWNQYHLRGVHYTNVGEYRVGCAFMEQLHKGDFEKAYQSLDIDGLKQEWLALWFEEDVLSDMERDGLAKFCEYAAKLEAAGGIEKYEYLGITVQGEEADGTPVYQLLYKIQLAGEEQLFYISVSDDGVEGFSGGDSFLDDPLAQFSIWSEYLWQDYKGCYYDPETKEYVYYEAG